MPTLTEHLDDALQAVLAARAVAGFTDPPPIPSAALDEALTQDLAFQDARLAFKDALGSCSVMAVEAAHHQAVTAAVEAGWLLATCSFGEAA